LAPLLYLLFVIDQRDEVTSLIKPRRHRAVAGDFNRNRESSWCCATVVSTLVAQLPALLSAPLIYAPIGLRRNSQTAVL
jgi:hypothetical protein